MHQHMVTTLEHPKLFSNKVYWAIVRENSVLPANMMTKAPLPRVATSSKGFLREESDLLTVHTSDGFDSDAYKLIEESSYHFSKRPSPGHVINAKPYGPIDTQKMVKKYGGGVVTPRIGLGYMPSQLVKISRQCKDKRSLTQYVMGKKFETTRMTMLCPTLNHRCLAGCSHQHHINDLLPLRGWEGTRLPSLPCFKD